MTIKIGSITLYKDRQPDPTILLANGWVHPYNLDKSFSKRFGIFEVQIVIDNFTNPKATVPTYTTIYAHHINDAGEILLKGYGTAFSTKDVITLLQSLEEEFDKVIMP